MSRTSRFEAIILRTHRFGDIHKRVTLLSGEYGVLDAIAYGAYSQKGKLRGVTSLFARGTCYLYTDPVKHTHKITDFDVEDFYIGINEEIVRFYTASLWVEVILKSYAGGEASELLLRELGRFLSHVERATGQAVTLISIQFLWRYIGFLGLRPDLRSCERCGRTLGERESRYYVSGLQGFVCSECSEPGQPTLQAEPAGYLMHTERKPVESALADTPSEGAQRNIRGILYGLLEDVLETRLNTLRTGSGII
jgi:DNA repair protein RecO (recombination protein O)